MESPNICLVMLGASFENVKHRLEKRIILFSQISNELYLLIDKMPKIQDINKNLTIIDLKIKPYEKNLKKNKYISFIYLFYRYLSTVMKMLYNIFKLSKHTDIFIFITGIPVVFPLMLLARLLGKKVIVMAGGGAYSNYLANNPKKILSANFQLFFERLCFIISNIIVAETKSSARFLKLEIFEKKIFYIGAMLPIDVNKMFIIKTDFYARKKLIGYIGGLTIGKGLLNFIESIPLIIKKYDVNFMICGDGPLTDTVKGYIHQKKLQNKVKIIKWVPYEMIPDYLNELYLLVLPSYSEGLPGIILEAMACGTPVLATPVGGIPDIIKDGETGFLIQNNSPECIAENVIKALNNENLNIIVKNARDLIIKEYSYESVSERYKKIIMSQNPIEID